MGSSSLSWSLAIGDDMSRMVFNWERCLYRIYFLDIAEWRVLDHGERRKLRQCSSAARSPIVTS